MSYKSIHAIMHEANKLATAVDIISSHKNVPTNYRKYLLKYYAVEVSGTDLLEMLLNDHPGEVVIHQGVVYQVVYTGTQMLKATDAAKVILSFRQTKHILNCPNYVVVSIKE